MCRLLGVACSTSTSFRLCLRESPQSLAHLSREHPDGWGVALFARENATWTLHKSVARAGEDALFEQVATRATADVLVAHVRQRTVGRTRIANTHPFRRGRWVFAHNGTLANVDYVRSRTSARRAHEVEGDTDSEALFVYLLSCLDAANAAIGDSAETADAAFASAVTVLAEEPTLGSLNFVMSDGAVLYAYRRGRPLFVLERRRASEVVAALIASEPLTDEPWRPVADGALLRVDLRAGLRWRRLAARSSRPNSPWR
jgi:predicted glutamine amidotransferase